MKKNKYVFSFALPLLVLLASAHAATDHAAPLSPAALKQIDAVFAPWDNTRSPGAAIAISRRGEVIFARGYGMANLEHDVPITPDSIFHVASISKQFTAACVQLLAMDGKLSWDDDVRKYVPELPDYGHPITLAHLAHHMSGLRDQWSLLRLAGWRDDDLITEADVLNIAARQKALNFAPGTEWLYCNTGYTLLAVVVKRVSGQSLREFAAARIFTPLGMRATHFHDDHTEIVRGRTSAYVPRPGGGWRISIPVFDTYGATSLFTTVGDLLKWEQNFVEPRVGGHGLVDAMQLSGRLNDGQATGYGLGLIAGKVRGVWEVGHSGSDAGYRTDVVRFPEHDLAIVVFCNLSAMQPALLTRKVAEIVLGPGVFAPREPPVEVNALERETLAGAYWNERNDDVRRLLWRNGKLTQEGSADALVPIGGGRFRLGESNDQIVLPHAAPGAAQELRVISTVWGTAEFRRVTAPAPTPTELAGCAGEFFSSELEARFQVKVTNGDGLEWRSARGEPVVLEPVMKDVFFHRRVGTIMFKRAASGEVIGLTISTGRVRRLAMTKSASGS